MLNSLWELIFVETFVAETEDTLTDASQLHVSVVELRPTFLVHGQLLIVHRDGGAAIEDSLRCTLHHQ